MARGTMLKFENPART